MFEACSGEAKFDEIAQRLGMSRRTLARRLKAQALSFGEILKQFRSDLIIRSTMMSHYGAAKAAVITFTRELGMAWARKGVRGSLFAWCSYSRSATVQRPLDKLGEVFDRRVPMPIYISRGRFTTDAVKDMMAKPENREEVVSNLFKSVGGRLIGWYLTFGPHDWLVIGEFPDNKAAASAVLAVAGGGSLSDVETTVAMTAAEAKATFEAAGKVAEDFRSAGRS